MKAIIIGAGKLGFKLSEALLQSGVDVTLMDSKEKVLSRTSDHLDILTIQGDGLDLTLLKEIQIQRYDLLVASTQSDESNALICTLAKKLGCKKTIARIRNPQYTDHLQFIKKELGIDHIVNPDLSSANEIKRFLVKKFRFYSTDLAEGKVQLVDIILRERHGLHGKKIHEVSGLDNVLIVAILREGKIIIPDGQTVLRLQDVLYFMGKTTDITELSGRFGLNLKDVRVNRAMILGGGKIGYYLAKLLSEENMEVSVIESSRDRCKYLAEKLKNVMVIHGDGTEGSLLQEEGLENTDAFISVTGLDEQNLLMSLVAKNAGVPKTIAKVSRPNYQTLTNQVGSDVTISPVNITVSEILKYIRGGTILSISLLLGGQAEVTEIVLREDQPHLGRTLMELDLPKGMIIGAIIREGRVIIPDGSTTLEPRDRVIIFCLESKIEELDSFLHAVTEGKLHNFWKKQGLGKLLR